MAMSEGKSQSAPKPVSASREGAPSWVVPAYVGGLVLLYLGERVLSTFESGHWAFTGPGLAAVLLATAARFVPTWQAGGERGRIEKLLGLLSVGGVVALIIYSLTTDWGMGKLGLLTAPDDKRQNVHAILTVAWTVLICVSVIPIGNGVPPRRLPTTFFCEFIPRSTSRPWRTRCMNSMPIRRVIQTSTSTQFDPPEQP